MSVRYVVCGARPWNREVFDQSIAERIPGEWTFIGAPDELTVELLDRLDPRFVFFLHWSWKVPEAIHSRWECVLFHMTDVPYGRGGSPLQHLILRGYETTRISAIRMVDELDAGPVYLKETLPLHGTAEEAYLRASRLSASMIARIVRDEPEPTGQEGEVVAFARRRPSESRIPPLERSLDRLHDFIRMLDAEGYPYAFLEDGGFRYEFRRASRYAGRVEASVTIRPVEETTGAERATEEGTP